MDGLIPALAIHFAAHLLDQPLHNFKLIMLHGVGEQREGVGGFALLSMPKGTNEKLFTMPFEGDGIFGEVGMGFQGGEIALPNPLKSHPLILSIINPFLDQNKEYFAEELAECEEWEAGEDGFGAWVGVEGEVVKVAAAAEQGTMRQRGRAARPLPTIPLQPLLPILVHHTHVAEDERQ